MPDLTKPLFTLSTTLSATTTGLSLSLTAITIPALLSALNHPTIPSQSSSMTRLSPSKPDALAPRETALILTQWRRVYALGVVIGPALFIPAALGYAVEAWLHYAPVASSVGNALGGAWGTSRTKFFALAAVANLAVPPFTGFFMRGINTELHRREEAGRGVRGEWSRWAEERKMERVGGTSEELLKEWAVWNGIRGFLPLVAVWAGFAAL